ncbi:MAG: P-type conjugative transfer protein TrbJ [Nitrosomonas sp.]|nr:P-type conjugative transfer protein TrbJ [Nitrosomonas sp.]
MKRMVLQWMLVLNAFVTAGHVNAGGLAVFDGANVTQTVITAKENVEQTLKQIEQYQTQLQQYENMIRNTVAPAAYIWAKAQYTMNRLVQVSNTLEYYRSQGGMDNFLNKYRNASYYSSSPCFNLGVKCSTEQWQSVREGQTNSTDAQKSANDASLRGLAIHQDEVPLDAAHLQLLQSRAETAEGHLAAIQYANQLAAFQSNQLLQLRTMMIGQYNAENSKEHARIDREAMQQAAHEAATKRLSPVTLPPAKVWNVRDIF